MRTRIYDLIHGAPAPTLGICLGCQWLGRAEGIPPRGMGETGDVLIERLGSDPIFDGLPGDYPRSQSHKSGLKQGPQGCEHLARTGACAVQVIRRKGLPVCGVQGHFERGWSTTTPHGRVLRKHFVRIADPSRAAGGR
ncbi:MAG: hypothetical protein P1V36_10290 [Planctomycetota bacterium]|nr:hypothetical protein [Planctomycetota bacterium]